MKIVETRQKRRHDIYIKNKIQRLVISGRVGKMCFRIL
jgi:hypothetical protein